MIKNEFPETARRLSTNKHLPGAWSKNPTKRLVAGENKKVKL